MSSSPILELKNISKNFGTLQALDGVDFSLMEGETHALVGENGAGKSTLMRILAGLYTEYEGEYLFDGRPIKLHSPAEALRHGIGMIHQELSVIPQLSVAENIFLGQQPLTRWGTIDWQTMNAVAAEELAKLGFNEINVQRPLETYSLGTQQVVEVLSVILSGARVLIMDEPTSALSPAEIEVLIGLIDTLRKNKRSIIYISHFLEEVMRVADRITVLRNGAKIDTLDQSETNVNNLVSLIVGREVDTTLPSVVASTETDHVLLELKDLNADVFQDINLIVGEGEVVGVYGAIGAGHFDLGRAIFGMYRVDSGTITVDGQVFPHNHSARYAINHGLAYAIESRRKSLLMEEPIYRNITLPNLGRIGGLVPRPQQEIDVATPAIDLVNVQPANPLNPVGQLSGGNQQKAAIARWLPFPPKVFVMSEPTRGMDVGAKREVLGILRDFRNEGYGVLLISAEPETVLSLADRVVVMSHGKIVAHMENQNLDKDVLMRLL